MTNRSRAQIWSIIGLIILALAIHQGGGTVQAQTASLGDDAANTLTWDHLSTATGDLPSPDIGADQTSALVLDVDRNGVDDLVVASRRSPGASMVWYQRNNNGWTKYLIESEGLAIEAGGTFYDIDSDGDLDIVMGGDSATNQVWWWENPYPTYGVNTPWTRRLIKNSGASKHHDQIFGDFDADGKAELVFWNQGAQTLFLAEIPADPHATQPWSMTPIYTWSSGEEREGLAVTDIDNDGQVDIVGAGYWFKHNGGTSFTANAVDGSRHYTRAAAGQLIPGGWAEMVFVPGDENGPIIFYRWDGSAWVGEDLLGYDVVHGHTLELADFNRDGNLDIFNAEMRLDGGNPDAKMSVFLGDGAGGFTEAVVATGYGNHQSKVGDLDGDGDVDILGKPFNWDTPRLDVWINETVCTLSLDNWQRHVIDADKPWRSLFIDSADIDKDGRQDLITGDWWYKNPGAPGGTWTRQVIGTGLNNMAAVYDFDNDGDMDILGTGGQGADPNSTFVWAENDGAGGFTMHSNIAQADGSFLQGVAIDRFDAGNSLQVALSWHDSIQGNQLLTLPDDPVNDVWTWKQLATFSQYGDLSAGDIDEDGKVDLLLGNYWQRNNGSTWSEYELHTAMDAPDRNELVDINGDGWLDAVVGFEPSGRTAPLAWYAAQPADPTETWTEHVIAQLVGPMSLDVQDMDSDGDPDIVVGEHNLVNPETARLIVYENEDGVGGSWREHVVYTGDEHHDGARVADIDGDGDLDIFSIGWDHSNVVLYENLAPGSCGPIANPLRILTHPRDVSVPIGEPASFSVRAAGDAPLSYQWQRDGVDIPSGIIPSAVSATLQFDSVTVADDGAQFRCVVTNTDGIVTSTVATLTVETTPIIVEQPQDVNAISGSWASFSVKAKGTPPLTYQWQRDGVDIPGATDPAYQMSDLQLSDDGARLQVNVSNSYGTVTSDEAVLHVNQSPARPVSDDFNTCALDTSLWIFTDPVGDSSYATAGGEQLSIRVPAGTSHDLWTGADDAPRMMQPVGNGDMEVVAKFDSAVTRRYQIEGLLIEGTEGDKVRTDFRFDGSAVLVFAATFDNGVATARIDQAITPPAGGAMWLRLTRRGDEWTVAYSFDGQAWTMVAPFTFAITVEKAGVFAGNAGDNPEHTVVVDYFFNTGSPISPEDSKPRDLPVSILGQGQADKNPDKNSYVCNEAITLTARPDDGWKFDRWDGAASGSINPITITYNISDTIAATFVEKAYYALNISITGNGAVTKNPDQATYVEESEVTLTAAPGSGWFFRRWQGDDIPADDTNATLILTMDAEKTVEAIFEETPPNEHSLTVNMVGQGVISRNPDQPTYVEGTQVTLTAMPNPGWAFKEWQGDDVPAGGADPILVLNMDSDKVVKAVFGHDLIVDTEGQGSVGKDPEQDVYLSGTQVTLIAIPDIGWHFKEWQGDVSDVSTDMTLILTVDASKRVKAVFEVDLMKMFLPVVWK
jgi:regulation of enolase protein 1 (concanavalin A-like superfamily)